MPKSSAAKRVLTPAEGEVTTKVAVLREHKEYQKVMEVQALH